MTDATMAAQERATPDSPAVQPAAAADLARHDEKGVGQRVIDPPAHPSPFWTVERAGYALLVLVAGYWRVWGLGAQPLSAWEAANSWPAWLVAHGFDSTQASTPTSALYYGLQWLLFWVGADGEWAARGIAAGAGIALVVLAWWWRGWLGRPAALVLAALLALDPWAVALSRMADGASLSLLFGFVALTALVNGIGDPLRRGELWGRLAAVATGLLVVSGPLGLNLLPVLALAVWLWRDALTEVGLLRRGLWWWLAASALLGGSLLLIRLDGVAWFASSVTVWLEQFDGRVPEAGLPRVTGMFDWTWLAARFVVEGALLWVLGVVGLVGTWQMARQGNTVAARWGRLLGGWLLWGLLLCLLPGRSPYSLAVLILPLALLSAPVMVRVWRARPRDIAPQELGAVVLTLLILLVSAAFWAAALGVNPTFDAVIAQATGVILGLALAILLVFGIWSRRQNAGWVAAALLVGLLVVGYARAGWRLSHATVTAPSGWMVDVAHPALFQLRDDVETLSAHTQGDPYQMPVNIQVASYTGLDGQVVAAQPDPMLGWTLRRMNRLTWGELPDTPEAVGLVISVAQTDEPVTPPLPAHYVGSAYDIEYHWGPGDLARERTADAGVLRTLWQTRLQPWWRWAMYRQVPTTPPTRTVILWAPRSGLQGDG